MKKYLAYATVWVAAVSCGGASRPRAMAIEDHGSIVVEPESIHQLEQALPCLRQFPGASLVGVTEVSATRFTVHLDHVDSESGAANCECASAGCLATDGSTVAGVARDRPQLSAPILEALVVGTRAAERRLGSRATEHWTTIDAEVAAIRENDEVPYPWTLGSIVVHVEEQVPAEQLANLMGPRSGYLCSVVMTINPGTVQRVSCEF